MSDDSKHDDSGLPAIIDGATKAAETSVVKDLLGRSFKAVGDYYGEQVEEYYKKKRENRLKNIKDHERQVANVTGEPIDILTRPDRGQAIERWVEVAADVPLEDAERAALFEAVLAQILSSHGTSDFQDVAERLSSSGVRALLNAPTKAGMAPEGVDRQSFERLRSLGLVRGLDVRQTLTVVAGWGLGTVVGFLLLDYVVPRFLLRSIAAEFLVDAVLISVAVLVMGIAVLSTKYRLTDFGRSLQQSARRFYQSPSSSRKSFILSGVPSGPIAWGALAALLVCALPLGLDLYLPARFRSNTQLPAVIISSPPTAPTGTPPTASAPVASQASSQPAPQATLTPDDIRTLIDVWRSVADQMNDTVGITNNSETLLSTWPEHIKTNRGDMVNQLLQLRDTVNSRRVSLDSLAEAYRQYPNVLTVLDQRVPLYNRLYRALESFANAVRSLPGPTQENFENMLRPYAGELKAALNATARWADTTRGFAQTQINELSKI
jgi:hypothetical protein